jgi:hypothetical protein
MGVREFIAKPELVLVFQKETEHGATQLVGSVCYLNANGELRNPLTGWNETASDLADFKVRAYVDKATPNPFGFSCEFKPFAVKLEQAESMVKVLRKVAKGMAKADTERGYVQADQFHEYIVRAAAILGVKQFRVRSTDRHRAVTGDVYRSVGGSGLQSWIADMMEEMK